MKKCRVSFVCRQCGHVAPKWMGRCSSCHEWNCLESTARLGGQGSRAILQEAKYKKISDIKATTKICIDTGLSEVNNLFGGGLNPGSTLLLGGAPGVGKSTFLLNLGHSTLKRNEGLKVLYVSAEEAIEQVANRCRRLKIDHDELYLLSECHFENLETQLGLLSPDILIIDSLQTLHLSSVDSKVGSMVQARELTNELMRVTQEKKMVCIIVGHVNKEKEIAGPMAIEHMVDVVLTLSHDSNSNNLFLQASKNRFASALETVILKMNEQGVSELAI